MNGAKKNYGEHGPKRNSRRWFWNRIKERIGVPAREAIVLYLAAAQDFDRKLALDHGFQNKNLIAVERDAASAKALETSGVTVIRGDIEDVVHCWTRTRRVDVLYADFCGGLSAKRRSWLGSGLPGYDHLINAVLAFNFLAGRESDWEALREVNRDLGVEVSSHRGELAADIVLSGYFRGWRECSAANAEKWGQFSREHKEALVSLARRHMAESSNRYVSDNGQSFHSCVFRHPRGAFVAPDAPRASRSRPIPAAGPYSVKFRKLKAHIAAKLAVRTMRDAAEK